MPGCCGPTEENSVGPLEDENGGKFGTKKSFDPNFKGPIKDRSCTDVVCCLFFIIFLLGEAVVAFFAFTNGDPSQLLYPTDSAGNLCGDPKTNPKNKYLLFFDISRCAGLGPAMLLKGGCPTPSICVEKCPSANWGWVSLFAEEQINGGPLFAKRSSQLYCLPSINTATDTADLESLIQNGKCAPYTVESKPMVQRCFPSILLKAADFIGDKLETAAGEVLSTANNETITGALVKEGSVIFEITAIADRILNDTIKSIIPLVVGFIIAMIVSFIYILLLRFLAGCMVWFTIFAFFIAFLGSACYCFYRYYFVSTKNMAASDVKFYLTADGWQTYLDYKEIWLAFGITASIFFLIFFIIIVFLRKRLLLAIALIGQASKAVGSIMSTLFFPIFLFIFEVGILAFWVTILLYLMSSTKPEFAPIFSNSTNSSISACSGELHDIKTLQCQFFKYTGENWAIAMQFYNVFMALWLLNFVAGLGQITLAGAFSSWFWAWEKPKDVPTFPILSSFGRATRYHLGSIAFGAFLIAVVQLIRIVLEYIDRKVKGTTNPCAKFCLCCLKCCFWCLEKFLKFITKNAYIMIAIYGKNFCCSAKEAFFLLMRNIVRVVVVDNVTGFVLFIGKLVVVGSITTWAYFFFNREIPWLSNYAPQGLNYFYVPVIIIAISTYFITSLFFSVFDFAVDTLFLCVMEDLERHDGTPDKPYYMSTKLMQLLSVDNKFDDSSKKEGCGLCCC